MNGFERIKSALNGIMPDRRPVMLHNFMLAAKEAGYTMKQYREDPEIAAKCHIQFVEKYGVDGILFDVDTALVAGSVGIPVDYPDDAPACTHEMLLRSIDEVDILQEVDIEKNRRIQHSLEAVKILKKYFKDEVFVRGNCDQAPFSLACSIRTPAQFMLDLMTNEGKAWQLIEYSTRICTQFVRLMAGAGADMISNGDSPAGPSMISPAMYKQFAYPFEKAMMEESHVQGVPYLLHICGNTDKILDQISVMELDAVELDYKTSIEKIYSCFHNRTTLFGTIDPSGVIALGTPDEVRCEARKILEAYRDNPRLVIGAGCAIPPTAPEENIRMIIRAVNDVK